MSKKRNKPISKKVSNQKINNGLEAVIGGSNPFNMIHGTSQLSQSDTLFKNLRGYLITNHRNLLSQMYVEHGIIETAIDLPVEDALRGGISIATKQLSEEEITEFNEDFAPDIETAKQGEKWKRLFGGGAVMIITNQKAETPLNIDAIKKDSPLSFKAIDLWELYQGLIDKPDDEVDALDKPLDDDLDVFNYYGKKIHRSRLIILKGKEAPSFIRPRLRGWGLSELECFVRALNQYLKSTDLSFEVLDEFKLDIFKIKGLIDALMSPQGEESIRKRVELANMQKNYQNALSMDAEDDYVQKQLSFSGLAEVQTGIRMQVASDLRFPLTKLFGVSASGFNSGEDDIENYNAMIESSIRPNLKRSLTLMTKLRMKQKFGFIPDDLSLKLSSLRMMSSEQEENVKTQKFNRLIQARQAGELSPEEFRESANLDGLFAIKLDPNNIPEIESVEDENGDSETAALNKKSRIGIEPKKAKEPRG